MKFHLEFAFPVTLILLFAAFPLRAQQRFDDHPKPPHVLQKIEQAYQNGALTLDQKVLYKFYAVNSSQKLPFEFQPQDSLPIKCGTPAIRDFHNSREQLSTSTVREIEQVMAPSTHQATEMHLSPSGRFSISYEITGDDAVPLEDIDPRNGVPDYVDEVAAAADSSYNHQVQTLGYSNPIPAGQTYRIEIFDLPFYGQTYISNGTTIIQIENDFSEEEGFPPNTDPEGDVIGAIKVTIAHELKHAIQYAATGWNGETDLWAEMDATLMEEVVYDNVNDYYNYLDNTGSIFNQPTSSFYPGSYHHVSWALFFEEKFGPTFWPNVWEIIVNNPTIPMVEAMSEQLGGTTHFRRAYLESQLWHFASGDNSAPNFGFEEREFYPDPTINFFFMGDDSISVSPTNADSLQPFSANYIDVQPSAFSGFVTVELSDISIPETGMAIIGYFNDGSTETAVLYSGGTKNIYYQTTWRWSDLTKMGIIVANASEAESSGYNLFVRSEDPQITQLLQNFPNPFYPSTTIRFSLPEQSHVQLKIYDVAGRLVQTLQDATLPQGFYEVPFDGSELASGIYFYQLITDDQSFVKKMTLIK